MWFQPDQRSSFLSLNDDILELIIASALETTSFPVTRFRTSLVLSHLSRRLRSIILGRSIFWRHVYCIGKARFDVLETLLERSRRVPLQVQLENVRIMYGGRSWPQLVQVILRAETLSLDRFVVQARRLSSVRWLPAVAPGPQSNVDHPLREFSMTRRWVPQIASLVGPQTTSLSLAKMPTTGRLASQVTELIHACPNLRHLSLKNISFDGIRGFTAIPPPWSGASSKQPQHFLRQVSIIDCPDLRFLIRLILLAYPQTACLAEIVIIWPKRFCGYDNVAVCAELLAVDAGWASQYRRKLVITVPFTHEYELKYLSMSPTTKPFPLRQLTLDSTYEKLGLERPGPLQSAVAQAMQDLTILDIEMSLIRRWDAAAFMDIWLGATWPALQTFVLRSSVPWSGAVDSFYSNQPQELPTAHTSVPALQTVSIHATRTERCGSVDEEWIMTKKWATICWRILARLRLDPGTVVIEVVSSSSSMTSEALYLALVAEQAATGAVPVPVLAK